jgi:hypothetical protein
MPQIAWRHTVRSCRRERAARTTGTADVRIRPGTQQVVIWLYRSVRFEAEIKAWLDEWGLSELTQTGFAQVDIDQLLDPAPARGANAMLQCLDTAITVARATDSTVAGMVVIPLPAVEDKAEPPTDHPRLSDVLAANWVYGPGHEVPGLYLLRQGKRQADADVEEYRLALPQSDLGHYAYYRAWRTLHERERYPREWSRAFYVHTD